jgi:hypothetical protein
MFALKSNTKLLKESSKGFRDLINQVRIKFLGACNLTINATPSLQ